MRHLFTNWNTLSKRLALASRRAYLFDLDGTLTPIVKKPEMARVPQRIRRWINTLANKPRTHVGIVSGRSMKSTIRLIKLPGLIFSGNHGLEIKVKKFNFIHPLARRREKFLKKIEVKLREFYGGIPGLLIENKRFSLSLHYRNVRPRDLKKVLSLIKEKVTPLCQSLGFELRKGKKIVEVRHRIKWDKGSAVELIRRRLNMHKGIVLYIGDDQTDEDAFRVLKPNDISVRVGKKSPSHAHYFLRNAVEVQEFLRKLGEV